MNCHALTLITLALLCATYHAKWIAELEVHRLKTLHASCSEPPACSLQLTFTLSNKPNDILDLTIPTPLGPNKQFRMVSETKEQARPTVTFEGDDDASANQWTHRSNITLTTTMRLVRPPVMFSVITHQNRMTNLLNLSPHKRMAPFHVVQLTGSGVEMQLLIRAYCSEGYTGQACDQECILPPNFHMDHVWCDGSSIHCRNGWTGFNCELRDPCTISGLAVCQNDAECRPMYTPGLGPSATATFRCVCQPGWTGPLCSIPQLELCRNPDHTFGSYSKIGYNWENDHLDKAIYYDSGAQTSEPSLLGLWRSDEINTAIPRGPWRLKLTNSSEFGTNEQAPRQYGLWRSPRAVQPGRISRKPRGLWRSSMPVPKIPDIPLTAASKFIYLSFGSNKSNIETKLFKIYTRIEPSPSPQPRIGEITPCPTKFELSKEQAIPNELIVDDEWTSNCYRVPCILLRDHLTQYPHSTLYGLWRRALSETYPQLANLKPEISFTWLTLRDMTPVTSVHFDCSLHGVQLTIPEKRDAFSRVDKKEWSKRLTNFKILEVSFRNSGPAGK